MAVISALLVVAAVTMIVASLLQRQDTFLRAVQAAQTLSLIHSSAVLAQQDEGHEAADDAAPAAPLGRRDFFGVLFGDHGRVGHARDDQSQQDQQHAENGGKQACLLYTSRCV